MYFFPLIFGHQNPGSDPDSYQYPDSLEMLDPDRIRIQWIRIHNSAKNRIFPTWQSSRPSCVGERRTEQFYKFLCFISLLLTRSAAICTWTFEKSSLFQSSGSRIRLTRSKPGFLWRNIEKIQLPWLISQSFSGLACVHIILLCLQFPLIK